MMPSTGRRGTPERPRDCDPGARQSFPQVRISIGDVFASVRPTILQTVLGSCVAVCLHDPGTSIGGMNHILLPEASTQERSASCGIHAMELLINEMMKLGADRRRFVAKCFGAGNVLACLKPPTVGDLNARFIREFLRTEAIPLLAQRLGGTDAVSVRFRTDNGHVMLQSVGKAPLLAIVEREQTYNKCKLPRPSDGDSVTLF
jgi:chemotaxis receptor (MCP) glutamine deamidase CheD